MSKKHLAIIALGLITLILFFISQERVMEANVALIERDVFFSNPDRIAVRLSPDGKYLSFVAPDNGVLNVYVAPIKEVENSKAVTHDRNRGVQNYFWSYRPDVLFYMQDQDGDENYHLYQLNIADGTSKDITPYKNTRAMVLGMSHSMPDKVLVGLNNRNPAYHDVYLYDITSGKMQLIYQNDEYLSFVFDNDLTMRFAMQMDQASGDIKVLSYTDNSFSHYKTILNDDAKTSYLLYFTADNQHFYMLDSSDRNTAALYMVNVHTGEKTMLAEDNKADISDVLLHPATYAYEGYASEYIKDTWHYAEHLQADIRRLTQLHKVGEMNIVSRTLQDDLWIVAFSFDRDAVHYYLYDRSDAKFLFVHNNRIHHVSSQLRPMDAHVINAKDNLPLVSYLTLPKQSNSPLVVFVHGGPNARDSWGFNSVHQWLANRGYAVLSVNYRGSTGFGKKFINIAKGEWSRKMHQDLIDAADWAVNNYALDKKRVAIFGGSYGGYATLVGLTFTPEYFACGVDLVGPSNLVTLMDSVPEYWLPLRKSLVDNLGGDSKTEEGRQELLARSPITYVTNITKPLLIGQGANDPRVKQQESDQMVEAMKTKGIPGTYVLYPDEGHGFVKPQNRVSFYALTEEFLGKHLKQPYQPLGNDLHNSSAKVTRY